MVAISKQMIGQFSQGSFQIDLRGWKSYPMSITLKTISVNSPDIYFSTDVRQELDSTVGKECAIVYQSFR